MTEKRKNTGIYRANFTYRDPKTGNPKRCRLSLGTRNRREAERKEAALQYQLENPPKEEETPKIQQNQAAFSGFAQHWLDNHILVHCKPSSVRTYKQMVWNHLVPFFQDRDLRDIQVEDVSMFMAALTRKKLAPKSINNIKGALSSMFSAARKWGYCEANPALKVKALRLPPPRTQFWVPEQSEDFLAQVKRLRPEWYTFFLCALRTGMRMGELVGLHWENVDFVRKCINVRYSYSHGHLTSPKSGKNRQIPMSSDLYQALKAHKKSSVVRVFPWPDGTYLTSNRIKHPFWTCIKAAGVPKIRFHDLRHTFASQLAMKGIAIPVVQALLGHSTLEMTMRYAHLSPMAKVDAVQILDPEPAPFLPLWGDSENREVIS
jgi:integrase